MGNLLTPMQKNILVWILDYTSQNGTEPTLEDIRKYFDYPHVSSVQRHTDALKAKGYLENVRGISLDKMERIVQVPLVGSVACGQPLLAAQNIEAYVTYDRSKLAGNVDDYFFLRAVGDSMNNTNINGKSIDDGDFILAKKSNYAEQGQRVVALINEEATVKRFIREDDHIVLVPESTNESHKKIFIFEDIMIQGIVKDVIKGGGE